MCDYSIKADITRPAKVGDRLMTKNFVSGTIGFCDISDDYNTAVCLLPGSEIALDEPVRLVSWCADHEDFNKRRHKVAIFRQFDKENPSVHHDYLEFPDGDARPLTLLEAGQWATVLQLPAEPRTEAEIEEQCRAEYVG